MANRSLTLYVEQEFGKLPHFILCAILEWLLMILLFLDGLVAFLATQFARFFDLRIPCLFCSRIDHIFTNFHYSDSICETHKKDVSSLAYCHNHKKLSDIRQMCEVCLLSFATERESDDNRQLVSYAMGGGGGTGAGGFCCCCGEALKGKSLNSKGKNGTTFSMAALAPPTPRATPRATFWSLRNEEINGLELSYTQDHKLLNETESEFVFVENHDGRNLHAPPCAVKEDAKAVKMPLIPETEDVHDSSSRTPLFGKGNKFFGIPLTDSTNNSPRFAIRAPRKSPLERTELAQETFEPDMLGPGPGGDNDSILNCLGRQVRIDRKSLMELYMELDEERSAAAVAANNAMAMITRLQAEKAAVQMEALQYQRMMEEQAEYDQEDLQDTHDMLIKREEDIKVLEAELEAYREKYGYLDGFHRMCEDEIFDEDLQEFKSLSCMSTSDEKSEYGTPFSLTGREHNNFDVSIICSGLKKTSGDDSKEGKSEGEDQNEPHKSFKGEKTYLLSRLNMEKKNSILSYNGGVSSLQSSPRGVNRVDEDSGKVRTPLMTRQLSHLSGTVRERGRTSQLTRQLSHLSSTVREQGRTSQLTRQLSHLSGTVREQGRTSQLTRQLSHLSGTVREQGRTSQLQLSHLSDTVRAPEAEDEFSKQEGKVVEIPSKLRKLQHLVPEQ